MSLSPIKGRISPLSLAEVVKKRWKNVPMLAATRTRAPVPIIKLNMPSVSGWDVQLSPMNSGRTHKKSITFVT